MSCILMYFALCGYNPELYKARTLQVITHIIFVCQILLAIFFSYKLFEFQYWLEFKKTKLGMINDVSEYLFALTTQWIVIIDSYIRRSTQRNFWQIFKHIDQKYHQHNSVQLGGYWVKFFEHFIFYVLFLFYILTDGFENSETTVSFMLVLVLNRNRVFYFLFYLELVYFELRNVEKEAKQMSKVGKIEFFRKFRNQTSNIKRFELDRMKYLREYYQSIYELSSHINSIFGRSNIVTVLCHLFVFVCDCNWMYLYRSDDDYFFDIGKPIQFKPISIKEIFTFHHFDFSQSFIVGFCTTC